MISELLNHVTGKTMFSRIKGSETEMLETFGIYLSTPDTGKISILESALYTIPNYKDVDNVVEGPYVGFPKR